LSTIKIISVNQPIDHTENTISSDTLFLSKKGIVGSPAHDKPISQIKLMGVEDYQSSKPASGDKNSYGEYGEHITTEGLPLLSLKPLDTLFKDNVVLEITHVFGKQSDDPGVYARILQGGEIKPGDTLHCLRKTYRVFVIALTSSQQSDDAMETAIEQVKQSLTRFFEAESREVELEHTIIPSVPNLLERHLLKAKEFGYDLIYTIGCEGIGPNDIVPDIVKLHTDREIPGIMEITRANLVKKHPEYILTRAVAGKMGISLFFNLPAEKNIMNDFLSETNPFLLQAIYLLNGVNT
jgi:molybdopterin biosynthesis enzyme MoaB